MSEKKFVAREPDYKGNGVAVWVDKDRNENTMLNIKILDSITVKAFKHIPKPKEDTKPQL